MLEAPPGAAGTRATPGRAFLRRPWVVLMGLSVVALVGTYAYRVADPTSAGAAPVVLEPVAGCRLEQAACRASGPAGAMLVAVATGARPLAPFTVRLRLQGIKPRGDAGVRLAFSMQGMEMGPNRYRMGALGKDEWSADVTLPFCTTRRVDWTLSVLVETAEASVVARFPFTLSR